jgi:flagellar hook assembly protein FlgD
MVQELNPEIASSNLKVYNINSAYRMMGNPYASFFGMPVNAGKNPPKGTVINYYAKNVTDTTKAKITIQDKNHKTIKTFATDSKDNKMEISKGMNNFNWNLQYPDAEKNRWNDFMERSTRKSFCSARKLFCKAGGGK